MRVRVVVTAAATLLAAVGAGMLVGLLARTTGELAEWARERRTDRLAR